MTYQVLARKYRPKVFGEVVGQDHVTHTLINALATKRLHHAYLFAGARGTGKTTVARILAKALNCTAKASEEPCGRCGPCTEITNGTSLDVQEIDGASNTGVDDVRELREHTKYLPSAGRYKIYIIDEVHMLSASAFNALLKTLEEPPPHVVFIFATTEAHKIPTTILSRCQRYDFRRIRAKEIAKTLRLIAHEEKIDAEDSALDLIAREATGSLRDAESLLDQASAFSQGAVSIKTIEAMLGFLDRKLLFDLTGAVVSRDPSRALSILDEVFAQGADLGRFATDVLEMLRHLLVLTECGDEKVSLDIVSDEVAFLKGLLEGTSKNLLRSEILTPSSETRKMSEKPGSVAGSYVDGFFAKSDEVAAEGAKLQPKEVFRGALEREDLKIGAPELHQMFSLWYRVAEEVSRSPFPKMLLEVGLVRLSRVGPVKPIEEIVSKLDAIINETRTSSYQVTEPPSYQATKLPSYQAAETPPPVQPTKPTFEPVVSQFDADAERRWDEFMRWVVVQRPQVASIFEHGRLTGIDDGVVKMTFDNPLYADMLGEEDRQAQVAGLLEAFFKRQMRMLATTEVDAGPAQPSRNPAVNRSESNKEIVREVLTSDIVRQAADILNAELHDVKVGK